MNISSLNPTEAVKKLYEGISDPKWRHIFVQNIVTEKGHLQWKCNMEDLYKNTKKFVSDVAHWGPSYGLWPGQALVLFAA